MALEAAMALGPASVRIIRRCNWPIVWSEVRRFTPPITTSMDSPAWTMSTRWMNRF